MTTKAERSHLRLFHRLVVLCACTTILGCSVLKGSSTDDGHQTQLGSYATPVMCEGVRGEREYLARLRCADDRAPAFGRLGSLGKGADGHTLERYLVQCGGEESVSVMMDLYHNDYREMAPIPGFTIVAELPTAGQTICPPEVPYEDYAFVDVEVAKPARLLNDPPPPAPANEVSALMEFVVGTDGVVEIDSVQIIKLSDKRVLQAVPVNLFRYRFSPAEHHPGCPVRERVNGVFLLDRSLH